MKRRPRLTSIRWGNIEIIWSIVCELLAMGPRRCEAVLADDPFAPVFEVPYENGA